MNVREFWKVIILFMFLALSFTMYSYTRFINAPNVNFTSKIGNSSTNPDNYTKPDNYTNPGNNTETKSVVPVDKNVGKSTVAYNCSKDIEAYFLKAFVEQNSRLEELNGVDEAMKTNGAKNITIGILIATTTRKLKCENLLKFSLFEIALPSVIKTATKGYLFRVYLGFDQADAYFSSLRNAIKSGEQFKCIRMIESGGNNFVAAVNAIAKVAYEDGVDYFVRVNDDTEFVSSNWSPIAIDVLQKYDPPYVGVVGPTFHEGKTSILTHDMVHRTHFEIFQYYYPPAFENWWADDWITLVYQPSRMTKLQTWTVKHHLTDMRYNVDRGKLQILNKQVAEGKIKLGAYSPIFKSEMAAMTK